MREFHVGDLVVVEERQGLRRPVGIVSDRDLVIEVLAEGVALDAVAVGDVMSRDLLTISAQDELFGTVRRMREQGVRRVPVVGGEGELLGILAFDDLIDLFAEQLNDLVALVGNQLRHERERRV
jgi:CBS domain-containing protein